MPEYIAVLKFRGKHIEMKAMPSPQGEVILLVPQAYALTADLVGENELRRITLYDLVFIPGRQLYLDPAKQTEYIEYEFAGVRRHAEDC